jgi:hypothetical protein
MRRWQLRARSLEPLLLPLTESGGAMRAKAFAGRLADCPHEAAAARRLTTPRSCSAPRRHFSYRSPRAAGRCAQKGAIAEGLIAARPPKGGGVDAEPRSRSASKSRCSYRSPRAAGKCAQKCAIAEGFVAVGPPKGGGVDAESTALVLRSQEPLQLPFTESGGALHAISHPRRRLLCSLAARGSGAELTAPRSFSTPKSRRGYLSESVRMALKSLGSRFRGRLLDGFIVAALSLLEHPGDLGQSTLCGSLSAPPVCRRAPEAPRRADSLRVFGTSISREGLKWRAFLTKVSAISCVKNPCDV